MIDDIDQRSAALNEQINAQLDDISQGIARIMAENERLRTALERTLSWLTSYPGGDAMGAYDVARAALAGPAEEERGS